MYDTIMDYQELPTSGTTISKSLLGLGKLCNPAIS